MNSLRRRAAALLAICVLSVPLAAHAQGKRKVAPKPPQKERVLIQVSDSDPKKWNLALGIAKDMQRDLGDDKVEIEIVAFGAAVKMMTYEGDVANRIENALERKIRFFACATSMKTHNFDKGDLVTYVNQVPSGPLLVIKRQREGWAYLRP
jgi:intracellular sulfur oxidation DsrE/DsrF family protein